MIRIIGYGLNGALCFVGTEKDGGKAPYGCAGANFGAGYCDAQCLHDLKSSSNEANVEDWVSSETDDNAGTGRYGTGCSEVKSLEREIAENQDGLDEATFIREKELAEFNAEKKGKRRPDDKRQRF